MNDRQLRRRHLRDVDSLCPVVHRDGAGTVWFRCELDKDHEGKHKDGCTWWGSPEPKDTA